MAKSTYIMSNGLNAPVEEAYRVLRSNIQFCGFEKPIKSIVITSCNPSEGKTSTVINLAISMAKSGMNVLAVDADLRMPFLTRSLRKEDSPGLSNLISGSVALNDVINATSIKGLNFIPSGPIPPNPAELLASARFRDIMQEMVGRFDMVLFDMPPVGNVIDGALVAAKADGTILVIKPGSVDYKTALRVKDQLEKANANILGVVLNKIKKRSYRQLYSNYNYYKSRKKFKLTRSGFPGGFEILRQHEKVVHD